MGKGVKLALVGLAVGFLIGLAVRDFKLYLASQLHDLLDSEAKNSCACKFESDPIDVSLLTLRARVKNARLVSTLDGTAKLAFKKMRASFSLAKIAERKIFLSKLDLIDGVAAGIGPQSDAYKFIAWLVAPLPPEKDTPDRWRLKLLKLNLDNFSFQETVGNSLIDASRGKLSLERDEKNNFLLKPAIGQLLLKRSGTSAEPASQIQLGGLQAELYLKDEAVEFKQIRLERGESYFAANLSADLFNLLKVTGAAQYRVDSTSFAAPDWLSLALEGSGKLEGALDEPNFHSSFSAPADSPLSVTLSPDVSLSLDQLIGKFDFALQQTGPSITVSELQGSGTQLSVKQQKPLLISSQGISGEFNLKLHELAFQNVRIHDLDLNLIFSGNAEAPALQSSGQISSAQIAGVGINSINIKADYSGKVINFELAHGSEGSKSLRASGQLELGPAHPARLSKLDLQAQALPLVDLDLEQARFWLDARGQLSGELSAEKIGGALDFTVGNAPFSSNAAFKGQARIRAGQLSAQVANHTQSVKAQAELNFLDPASGTVTLDAKNFSIADIAPEQDCLHVDLHSEYKFSLGNWREGQGQLELARFELGCDTYKIWLSQPYRYEINNGALALPSLVLNGSSTNLNLAGKVSLQQGIDLQAKGKLDLHALLPVLPDIDQLAGNVEVSANLKGPFAAPQLLGEANISEGELGVEAANLNIEQLQGMLRLSSGQVKFETLSGLLNGGVFNLAGIVLPANLNQSNLHLSLQEIFLEPAEATNLTLSGELNLTQSEQGRPVIQGELRIEHAELQREVDLVTILRSLVEYLFSIKQAQRKLRSLPDIDLDIRARATNNLFIFTNWLAAELKANLKIAGTLSQPQIRGKLETLSGWFGFKDRRFDINSGVINFKPEWDQPQLDLLSESYFVSPNADNLVVFLEANGPLTNPRIELSSDSGLSQREILNLLTSGQTSLSERGFERSDAGVKMAAIPLIQNEEQYMLGRFFSRLTSIDSISLEPAYNPQRGVIDPTIVAIKHLSDRLYLRGESFFSGSGDESKLSLFYYLTPKLSVSGIIDAVSQEDKTALGFDLTYTALSKQPKNIEIEIDGAHYFERSEIMQRLRVSEMSMLEAGQIDKLKQTLLQAYQEQGYFHSQVDLECTARSGLCVKLKIEINEGQRSKVQTLIFEGDPLPKEIPAERFAVLSGVKTASADLIATLQTELIKKLRSEGYISARVTGGYQDIEEIPFRKLLLLQLRLGKPVSFVFSGNHAFSDEQLLETINLFGRKQPFGNNTINLLVQNIERKYREAGFLFVAINNERISEADSDRITYRIQIEEEAKLKVSKVEASPASTIDSAKLRELIRKHSPDLYEDIFEPEFAIAEKLESNIILIREALIEDGYPQAQVSYRILPDESQLVIQYTIHSSERVAAIGVSIENWPEGISQPSAPQGEVSVPQANRYLNLLLDRLIENGFVNPQVVQDFGTDLQLVYKIQAGQRTHISRIKISGNKSVSKALILKRLQLKKGQVWNADELYQAKTKLLKLGLFSRVDIRPLDGRLNESEEGLSLRVQEKPLRTLEIGSGLNSEYGLHIFGEASDRELFSDGRNLSFRVDSFYDSAQAEISQGVASLKYVDPYLFDSDYSLTEDFRFQKLDLSSQEFNLDRLSLGSQLYRTWRGGTSLSLAHTILQEDLNDVSPGAVLSELDTGILNLSMLSVAFAYDQRDNPLNPQRGYTLFLNSQVALKELASDAGFYTVGSRASFLYPLPLFSKRLSIAHNLHWQSAWSFENTPEIPISQRFYLGGRNTVRGFRENSLGPRGSDGSVIGGDMSALANVELRYLVAEAVALHSFFDAGNVFLRDANPDYGDMRLSAGLGVRYLSPIGPIGLDLGHPLDERKGEPSLRVHFNIGSNF